MPKFDIIGSVWETTLEHHISKHLNKTLFFSILMRHPFHPNNSNKDFPSLSLCTILPKHGSLICALQLTGEKNYLLEHGICLSETSCNSDSATSSRPCHTHAPTSKTTSFNRLLYNLCQLRIQPETLSSVTRVRLA